MDPVVHFEILSEQPERAVAFYRDAFGWDVATWDGPQTYWLSQTRSGEGPGINGAIMGRHFPQAVINTIQVASLDDTLRKIEAGGGRKVHGPNVIPGVGTHAYCEDPDGTLFGVMEPLSGN